MPTVHQITKYSYQFHGGANGFQNSRSILRLEKDNTTVAHVHFVPNGLPIPDDTQSSNGFIKMYMPESAITAVIDMLRYESPICIYHVSGNTCLYVNREPDGEGEV